MDYIEYLKKINYFNIVNFFFPKIEKLINFKFYRKKKVLLRNSHTSETLLKRFFKKSLNYEEFRKIFFKNKFFYYTNEAEKPKIIELLKLNCLDEIENYLEYAENIIKNEYQIFEKSYKFIKKIDWHYSFFEDFHWEVIESEKLNLYPPNMEVDVKYVWEFNRHQHLIYLGFAYYYTSNEIYAKTFKKIILDWIRKNPPLYGINWYSGLEISLRLVSWIFTLLFFKDSKEIDNTFFFRKIFKSMFQHAFYLKYFYSRRKFNHTVGDIFGLYFFSKVFEDIQPLKKWERSFFEKFKKQILLQTRSDGSNIEQSLNYHRFILEFFTLFLILNPKKINIVERNCIEKMFEFLLYLIKPNGKLPQIGDFDNGKVLLLTYYNEYSYFDLINLGSIIFQNNNLKFLSKKISPIAILLLGSLGKKIYDNIEENEIESNIHFFKKAGYILIRNNWNKKANYLFVDYGKFGAQHAGHSHSSITNVIFSYKGNDIIIDSGTYNYNKSLIERNFFRGSSAHNILTINRKNQAKEMNIFAWDKKPKIKRIVKINNDTLRLICYHNGFNGFITKREINTNQTLKNFIIKDKIFQTDYSEKNELFHIDICFHFNKNVKLNVEGNQIYINNEIRFNITSKHNFKIIIKESRYSPSYGYIYENKKVKIHLEQPFKKDKIIEIETKVESID